MSSSKLFDRFYRFVTPNWVYGASMQAVRNGFLYTLPLVIVGCCALLLNNFPVPVYQHWMGVLLGSDWQQFGNKLWNASFGIISLLMLYGVSQHLVMLHNQRKPLTRISTIISTLISLAVLTCLFLLLMTICFRRAG